MYNKFLFLIVITVFFALPAWAQDKKTDTNASGKVIENLFQSSLETNKTLLNYPKHPKNPMKYDYQPEYDNYLNSTSELLAKQNIALENYHFKEFPIKYCVKPSNLEWEDIIRICAKDFGNYFPLIEVNKQTKADIIIEILDPTEFYEKTGSYSKLGAVKTGYNSNRFEAYMFLSSKIFSYPPKIYSKLTIKHEFIHALGVIGHSESPNDVLHPGLSINVTYGSFEGTIKETGEIKNFETFGTFSPRDLNTLWLLYNQW